MAFVLEKISEEDKQKYGFAISPDRWAIDRERGMFLIHVGGMGMSGYANFELNINGKIVKIITNQIYPKQAPAGKYDADFEIESIHIPSDLEIKTEEIKLAVTTSLKTYGFFGNPNKVGNIEVFLPSQINFY